MHISHEKMNMEHILTDFFLFLKMFLNMFSILGAVSAIIARLQSWHSSCNIILGFFY